MVLGDCLVAIEVKRASEGVEGFAAMADYDQWRESAKEHGLNSRRFKECLDALIKKSMVLENAGMYRTVPKTEPEVAV